MSSTTTETPDARGLDAETASAAHVDEGISRWWLTLGVVAAWVVGWLVLRGKDTLALGARDTTAIHDRFTEFRNDVLAGRDTNPVIKFTYWLGAKFGEFVDWLQRMVSIDNFPRPYPEIGWLGVTAIAVLIGLAIAGWRISLLIGFSFFCFAYFGFWSDSMDLLIVTFVSVLVVVLVGMPVAVAIGTSTRARAVVTPILDLIQTMPTFVYLLPIVLFFGIGASAAVICTLIYAFPPLVRIAGHGIRTVPESTIEATDSYGQTRWQRLLKVQLPMARKTTIVGLNQTIMAALSMATIASFVNGPGLGKPVLSALIKNDVGGSFVPGMLIVLMAIMLDRTATAASERPEKVARGEAGNPKVHRALLAVVGAFTVVAVYLSRTYPDLAGFPANDTTRSVANQVDKFFSWVTDTFGGFTEGLKNVITTFVLNPAQNVLAESPWWLTGLALLAIAWIFGRTHAVIITFVCLAGIRFLDLWHNAMITLNMTLVATAMAMVLALVVGVAMGRNRRTDLIIRPILDAGQTIPPFVYLIPVLGLFGPSRFTGIVAALVYAAPAAIKLVADGIKQVSPTTIEASRSTGTTMWQEITKVQLPMARGSIVLAANQGLLYVLAMVVIGGLVGSGALGYDVVLGFSRSEAWGKGFAAGLTIVLLGIMVDRITRSAAELESS